MAHRSLAFGMFAVICAALFLAHPASADPEGKPIGFVEDFALAEDRGKALEELVAGTRDYYYYHGLHHQNRGELEKAASYLKAWARNDDVPETGWRKLKNRQMLLRYTKEPETTLAYLRDRLHLHFNHERRKAGEEQDYPSEFDPELISRERLLQRALSRSSRDSLDGFTTFSHRWLAEHVDGLEPQRRHDFLSDLNQPDIPRLVKLVHEDLNWRHSGGFGGLDIHGRMTRKQLEELIDRKPEVRNDSDFIRVYLMKLAPSEDVDLRQDREEKLDYLNRLWEFARTLGPAQSSLKVHVLYHLLKFKRSAGEYDRDLFMTYLKLPRRVDYIRGEYYREHDLDDFYADLDEGYPKSTLFSAVGTDRELVQAYLAHFLAKAEDIDAFRPYIESDYLEEVFAKTKLLRGVGNTEKWYGYLDPEEIKSLKSRVDLDFAPTNRRYLERNEQAELKLDVKNVSRLMVKIYRIDAVSVYKRTESRINTSIDLEGLVPNVEKTFTYDTPPIRRVRRTFSFDELTKPGTYVVDFIGNGKASRTLIRKGKLDYVSRPGSAGHVITVLDEKDTVRKEARVYLGGTVYTADEDGSIVVPYAESEKHRKLILATDELASLVDFRHRAENYDLKAGFHVPREQLLQRNSEATLLIRPDLRIHGHPADLELLEDVRLTITSKTIGGVSSTRVIRDLELKDDEETEVTFAVPNRLSRIQFRLKAEIRNLSRQEDQTVSASDDLQLNQIEKTHRTRQLLLRKIDGGYVVEMRGRTGERLSGVPLNVRLKHHDFTEEVHTQMQTDEQGRLHLGGLPGIVSLHVSGSKSERSWPLISGRVVRRGERHGVAGEPIRVPYLGDASRPTVDQLSLLERRQGTYVRDRFDALRIEDDYVVLEDLPAGDYELRIRRADRERVIHIRLAEGKMLGRFVLGDSRRLETSGHEPLHITSAEAKKDKIHLRIAHATDRTRVHVVATRYRTGRTPWAALRTGYTPLSRSGVLAPQSLYAAEREIGDEHQYILNRRAQKTYPGNMLERPGLLLNPWAVRKTTTGRQKTLPGEEGGGGGMYGSSGGSAATREGRADQGASQPTLDFLAEPSAMVSNLRPGEGGTITIPRKKLGRGQEIHVLAAGPGQTVYRTFSVSETDEQLRDLRLNEPLDPEKHFTRRQHIESVAKDETVTMEMRTGTQAEVFGSLKRVHRYYETLTNEPHLSAFSFILEWPEMDEGEKLEKYGEYACHELNFFLYQKDRDFFEKHIRDYLANKKDKTFMDRYLLKRDLSRYLKPRRYRQLNAVERILLSERIDGERPHTTRHIRDWADLTPFDDDRFLYLFRNALRSAGLDQGKDRVDESGFGRKELQKSAQKKAPENAGQDRALESETEQSAEAKQQADDSPSSSMGSSFSEQTAKDFAIRKRVRQLYRKTPKTKEWAENNYYELPIEQQDASLVPANAFWAAYAKHDRDESFRSGKFIWATKNFTEMMFALSVLDLPFESAEHKTETEEGTVHLTPGSDAILFRQDVREAEVHEEAGLLVRQNFFRQDDRYRHEGNQRVPRYVRDEFLRGVPYGCQVVVTNPTSEQKELSLLMQIPEGAMPTGGSHYTDSVHLSLKPHRTETVTYHFYFPRTGDFRQFPVHASRDEKIAGHAEALEFNVVAELSDVDKSSWAWVSQNGSKEQVLDYLKEHNLHRTDLERIAWRMDDKPFFRKVIDLLEKRHAYNATLWSYGLKHDVPEVIETYLSSRDGFVRRCGKYLESPLLTIDPVVRRDYQHLEYKPLVNARVHRLGRERKIVNPRLHAQYTELMHVLSYKKQLSDEEHLALVYYLLLQHRITEALEHFEQVDRANVETKLQYDYFATVIDFYQGDLELARSMAKKYSNYAIPRWRKLFRNVKSQLAEIDGEAGDVADPDDRSQRQDKLAGTEPSFAFKVENRTVTLSHRNLEAVTVNYYPMDIELLFSRKPFVESGHVAEAFNFIEPKISRDVALEKEQGQREIDLPQELSNTNVMVEVEAAGQSHAEAYYANTLSVHLIDTYGQLKVTHRESGDALDTVYVKVYARMENGEVQFYKDGYTDRRGRFDYVSLNTDEIDDVKKLSILILSEKYGAVVRETAPPAK